MAPLFKTYRQMIKKKLRMYLPTLCACTKWQKKNSGENISSTEVCLFYTTDKNVFFPRNFTWDHKCTNVHAKFCVDLFLTCSKILFSIMGVSSIEYQILRTSIRLFFLSSGTQCYTIQTSLIRVFRPNQMPMSDTILECKHPNTVQETTNPS